MIMASTDISNTVGEQTDEKSSDRTTAAEREAAMQTAGASRQSTSGVDSSTWFSGWRLMLLRVAVLVVTLVAWDVRSEERRVGKECVSTGRSRWARGHLKK